MSEPFAPPPNPVPTVAEGLHPYLAAPWTGDVRNGPAPPPPADTESGEEASGPVVQFIDRVLETALNRGASDIHFEPYPDGYRVRLRLDGVLRTVARPPPEQAPRLAARLKVMARLDISERRLPQDGRLRTTLGDGAGVDARVATLPTLGGEKVVLRLVDPLTHHPDIDSLGMEPDQQRLLLEALDRSQGLILVTGPTGSGKTLTLYTALARLNDDRHNIATAEDPAEVALPGVNQVTIQPRAGLDFATALRAFLRQDPDVIMVGEMRDAETAGIAIKAAQTGHLVLSTLHTADAPRSLARLQSMGVAAHNIATSVTLVIAQRLVRRLCPRCARARVWQPAELAAAGHDGLGDGPVTLHEPVGCDHCHEGYRGRLALFQVMPFSAEMARLVLAGGDSLALAEQANREGVASLYRMGLARAAAGLTSLVEVERATREFGHGPL
ncbi:MAG: GspE/PulE family protein [Pseudomonadota bacterium]